MRSSLTTSVYVRIYRSDTDCTNGGISSKRPEFGFTLYRDRAAYESDPKADPDASLICIRHAFNGECLTMVRCEPPEKKPGVGPVDGGNYAYSCFSDYKEITGVPYPIPIFDRFDQPIRF